VRTALESLESREAIGGFAGRKARPIGLILGAFVATRALAIAATHLGAHFICPRSNRSGWGPPRLRAQRHPQRGRPASRWRWRWSDNRRAGCATGQPLPPPSRA